MTQIRVRVIKASEDELEVEVEGEGHTLLNLLVDELNRIENVRFAAYAIDHPEFPVARLRVLTKGASPIEVLSRACESIAKRSQTLRRIFKEEIEQASSSRS